ncbi:hypothetical protein [Nonomuraea turcica]|uniref:hypothetical protein n=1 Tax=Nonomuraea sp. G32 TaxID=3067274 RepID=UPI00273C96B3|nr:hypothetical protein [Nonomuraea sp. G32]MDP4502421.1 hypothetical protein [Nonomuraea sp. G32]
MIVDTRGPLPVSELGSICAEPTEPMPALLRGELLTDLDDATVAALMDAAGRESVAPLVSIQIRHLGGALARPRQTAIAQAMIPHTSGRKPFTY